MLHTCMAHASPCGRMQSTWSPCGPLCLVLRRIQAAKSQVVVTSSGCSQQLGYFGVRSLSSVLNVSPSPMRSSCMHGLLTLTLPVSCCHHSGFSTDVYRHTHADAAREHMRASTLRPHRARDTHPPLMHAPGLSGTGAHGALTSALPMSLMLPGPSEELCRHGWHANGWV
jgi:hypothetical protein